ncbi:MAG: hypothetical protein U0521_20380 [Anaerolineae bacterium]
MSALASSLLDLSVLGGLLGGGIYALRVRLLSPPKSAAACRATVVAAGDRDGRRWCSQPVDRARAGVRPRPKLVVIALVIAAVAPDFRARRSR